MSCGFWLRKQCIVGTCFKPVSQNKEVPRKRGTSKFMEDDCFRGSKPYFFSGYKTSNLWSVAALRPCLKKKKQQPPWWYSALYVWPWRKLTHFEPFKLYPGRWLFLRSFTIWTYLDWFWMVKNLSGVPKYFPKIKPSQWTQWSVAICQKISTTDLRKLSWDLLMAW